MSDVEDIVGYVDVAERGRIVGWAADKKHPERELTIRVSTGGRRIARTIANQQRDDLRSVFVGSTGRYHFVITLDPPLTRWQDHEVTVVAGESATLPGRHRIPRIGARSLRPKPLIVASSGRAGSSLLMSRLSRHPDILVADRHPYEIKMLTYYALSLMVHTSDADRVNSLDPDKMGLPHNQFAIGRNPYNAAAFAGHRALRAYWVDRLPRLLKDAFRETILAYYDAQRISLGRSDFQVFAEKTHTDPELRGGIHFLFPEAKEILLIRDPRDLLCSYSNFFQTPQATAIDLISGHLHCIMESRSREDILFVKYEDLVIDLPATLQRVCEYLELSRSDGMLKDEGVFGMHGTSKTPHSSIGRWREELGSDWTIPLNWKPFLSVFDYDL